MIFKTQNLYKSEFGISDDILSISNFIEKEIKCKFNEIDKIKEYNQLKVIKAMQKNRLSDIHFGGTTGYGYDDIGRDTLDKIYADVFKTESALVRHNIVAGTHAIALCLYGNLKTGDELLTITGKPYDTLEQTIGISKGEGYSLQDMGITYTQIDLLPEGEFDVDRISNSINEKTKMVYIQRSRGYSWRNTISIEKIGKVIEHIKNIKNNVIIMVDNCYGEFVEEQEPTEVGADIIAGSLIKNPGGGIALTGGYVAGKEEYVNHAAYRLTAPGLGKKLGPSLGNNRNMIQGLFMAPHVVSESVKGALFCARIMEKIGYEVSPKFDEKRGDIIQAIKFGNKDSLIAFCQGIQSGSVVDAFVVPEPWDMPGYESEVIMAAGAFVQGASIELSADAPIKEPYIAYMQGGLVYENVKLGVMIAIQKMSDKGIVRI